ncbi:MAG: acetate--CoA ligase [Gemmatimonadaceae bacterium]
MDLINPIVRRWTADGASDPTAFWARAADALPWFTKWHQTFEWTPPRFKWFLGGTTNLAFNCLDHHVQQGRGGHAALIYLNERGERRTYTYAQLLHGVRHVAASLRALGVGKGDRLTIYMPVSPEGIMAMLATLRIGAIHSVVFAGFGAGALGDRIRASGSRLVVTTDVGYRKGQLVPLKPIVDAALATGNHAVEKVVVVPRGRGTAMTPGRDIAWDEFLALGRGPDSHAVAMESNEAAYILATSGTTAKPKLAVHVHGGYQVFIHSMGKWCFGLKPNDVWWATADMGWAVGHSYMVYAPLLAGCTTIAYEGAYDHPAPDVIWRVIEEFAVTGIFTSPTLVRMLMRHGDAPLKGADFSTLERVVCAGEVLNAPAWEWLQKRALGDRIPVIDHMWQTETGGPIFGNPYGIALLPIKPGSSGIPLPGIEAAVVRPDGTACPPAEKGIMVITRPFPGLCPTLWGDAERYQRDYWDKVPGRTVYFSGDSAHIDTDGYVWFAGRADEVLNIASHRIGTIEVESAILTHPAVAEAGVTGSPDELRGEVIAAFCVLKNGVTPSEQLRGEILHAVREELGAFAVVGNLYFVPTVPKTRSGKIMRRVLKAIVLGRDPGDITTIEDESSVEEARAAYEDMRAAVTVRS